jgi:hypothetical protein
MNTTDIAMLVVLIIIGSIAIYSYYKTNLSGKSKEEVVSFLKIEALKLFLYAQKQGWTGDEKMDWCVIQILKLFPDKIDKYVEQPIRDFLQAIYDEYIETLKKEAEVLQIKLDQ